jgi:hypothetical protein
MRLRMLAAPLAALVLAAAPAAAHAQSGSGGAGDQQYQDPFGSSSPSKPKPKPSRQGSGTTTAPSLTQAPPASSTTAQSTPALGTSTPEIRRTELPRTGLDVRKVALAGVVLVLLGVALRLRSRPADGRR